MHAARTVLAEYFCAQDRTLLFIVRDDFEQPQIVEIAVPVAEIREYALTRFGTVDGKNRVPELDEADYQRAFGPFVEPIAPWVAEGDIVWFVPHDALHYLPLHGLPLGGRPLIERNPVCYAPSASVMKYCRAKRKGRRKTALVLGDSRGDLPHARDEALTVAALFGTTPYLRSAATRSLVRETLARRGEEIDIIHFACHGVFDSLQPLRSGIELAPETDQSASAAPATSWRLTAEEILRLEMHTDLVTLSACESGVSERRAGDELIGLTRALMYAGTPSVVVSLWRVNSLAAQILMEHFYRAILGGALKAVALQQAQLAVRGLNYADVVAYVEQRRAANAASHRDNTGQIDAWLAVNLLALERERPAGALGDDWLPFDRIYYWAPFVLVGDWF